MEEQAVLQLLSFGLEFEHCHVDCVNVTTARARRQILLNASFDKPPHATGSCNVLKSELLEVINRCAARLSEEMDPQNEHHGHGRRSAKD